MTPEKNSAMRWIPFTILVLIGALLEAGNLLNLVAVGSWHIRPSVLIVLLVFFAINCRTRQALIASFIIGLAMDATGTLMGPHVLSYCIVGGLLNQLSDHFPSRRVFHQAMLVFVVFLAAEITAYWLMVLKTGERQETVYQLFLLRAVYSACVAPFFWRALQRINRLIAFKTAHGERGYFR